MTQERFDRRIVATVVRKTPQETLEGYRARLGELITDETFATTLAGLLDAKDKRVQLRALELHAKVMGVLDDSVKIGLSTTKTLRIEVGGMLQGRQSLKAEAVEVDRGEQDIEEA